MEKKSEKYIVANTLGLQSKLNETEIKLGDDTFYLANYESMMDYLENVVGYEKRLAPQTTMVQKMYDDVHNESMLVLLAYNSGATTWTLEDVDSGTSNVDYYEYVKIILDSIKKSGKYENEAEMLADLLFVYEEDMKAAIDMTEEDDVMLEKISTIYGFDVD